MAGLADLAAAVFRGDDEQVPALVEQALAQGIPAGQILEQGLQAGMADLGVRFRDGDCFVPEVLVAADAMKAGMAVLRPHLASQGVKAAATAVIGTVKGDLHDIGKNLVGMMLEGAGFEVVDLGVDVPAEKFVQACEARPVQVLGLSALLTTTVGQMAHIVKHLRETLPQCPKIIIGGAAATQEYADRIGADGYGRDAASGAMVARQLVGNS